MLANQPGGIDRCGYRQTTYRAIIARTDQTPDRRIAVRLNVDAAMVVEKLHLKNQHLKAFRFF